MRKFFFRQFKNIPTLLATVWDIQASTDNLKRLKTSPWELVCAAVRNKCVWVQCENFPDVARRKAGGGQADSGDNWGAAGRRREVQQFVLLQATQWGKSCAIDPVTYIFGAKLTYTRPAGKAFRKFLSCQILWVLSSSCGARRRCGRLAAACLSSLHAAPPPAALAGPLAGCGPALAHFSSAVGRASACFGWTSSCLGLALLLRAAHGSASLAVKMSFTQTVEVLEVYRSKSLLPAPARGISTSGTASNALRQQDWVLRQAQSQ